MGKRKSKSPKTCTIGLGDSPSSVKLQNLSDAKRFRSQLISRARKLIRASGIRTEAEMVTIGMAGAAEQFPIPSPTNICAYLFIIYMQKLAESDAAGQAYYNCIAGQVPV